MRIFPALSLASALLLTAAISACSTGRNSVTQPATPASTACGATNQVVANGSCASGAAIMSYRCENGVETVGEFVGCVGAPPSAASDS